MLRYVIVLTVLMVTTASADTPAASLYRSERDVLSSVEGSGELNLLEHFPAAPDYSREYLAGLDPATGGTQWQCLTEALYFEARGESVKGQFAVAEVILNRVDSTKFPDTICDVVKQGTRSGQKYACQFTYNCDGKKEVINEPKAFERVGKVAYLMTRGALRKLTDGATYYHTNAVRPSWAGKFTLTATIGVHHFYRPSTLVSQN